MLIEPLAVNAQNILLILTLFATTDQNIDMMIDGVTETCTVDKLCEGPSKIM